MTTPQKILSDFSSAGVIATEGHCSPAQMEFFLDWLKDHPTVKTIFEIGFNAGHSAYTFLSARDDITVVSLDLGAHDYVIKGKKLIDAKFPGRHTLLIGDSTKALHGQTPTVKMLTAFAPDLLFIDGGHDDDIPYLDIVNSIKFAKPGSWLLIDDVIDHHIAVVNSVKKTIGEGRLAPLGQFKDGAHRGWLLAKPLY